jgi:hypothetical protein
MRLRINHLRLSLEEVPAAIVEEAVSGLEGELARRADVLRTALKDSSMPSTLNLGELSMGPLQQAANLDAAGLRVFLAEQLIGQLYEQISARDAD